MGYTAGLTRESGAAPFERVQISLLTDRTNGEDFPQFEGEFFYVESVDLPCRIAFNGRDESQSVGLSSGFQINMPFSGFKLFHDDYSVGNKPRGLSLYISRSPRAVNQFVNPTIQSVLPYRSMLSVGLNSYRAFYPLFQRQRFLSSDILLGFFIPGQINSPYIYSNVNFVDENDVILGASEMIRNGKNYNKGSYSSARIIQTFTDGTGNFYFMESLKNLPVPHGASELVYNVTFFNSPFPTIIASENHSITVS